MSGSPKGWESQDKNEQNEQNEAKKAKTKRSKEKIKKNFKNFEVLKKFHTNVCVRCVRVWYHRRITEQNKIMSRVFNTVSCSINSDNLDRYL